MHTAGLLEALDALPGVVSTAGAGSPPFFRSALEAPVHRRGQSLDVEIATVAERRKEIAVRIVCGARPRNLAALVLRETAVTVGVGVALGLPAALAISHLLANFLFGVTPTSMPAFAVALAGLAAAACIATLPSGLPASRIDVKSNLN
jgi:hypothetical protein